MFMIYPKNCDGGGYATYEKYAKSNSQWIPSNAKLLVVKLKILKTN